MSIEEYLNGMRNIQSNILDYIDEMKEELIKIGIEP